MLVNIGNGRWLAEQHAQRRLVELPGRDHNIWYQDRETTLGEVQEFLTGTRTVPSPKRILATVLFTDIVDSTRTAVELGDRRWRDVLERHAADVREALPRFRGREIKSTGDGFLRRLRRACAGRSIARRRSSRPPRRSGSACALACTPASARRSAMTSAASPCTSPRAFCALSGPAQVLVSRTVKDLVAGSGITFSTRAPTSSRASQTTGSCTAGRLSRLFRRPRAGTARRSARCAGTRARRPGRRRCRPGLVAMTVISTRGARAGTMPQNEAT